ncbi:hypothetical protein ON058_07480 [Demequina sp. B12]|uniref:hypothetical protein n=1 Tax=Demequina sp. B12 TaxID=2992757 RepID=UPI00237C4BAD|nr:hypothetical protein [Demequina sp. B12]MDE0573252.1 hypothetical protein [Demequina sp. B12]
MADTSEQGRDRDDNRSRDERGESPRRSYGNRDSRDSRGTGSRQSSSRDGRARYEDRPGRNSGSGNGARRDERNSERPRRDGGQRSGSSAGRDDRPNSGYRSASRGSTSRPGSGYGRGSGQGGSRDERGSGFGTRDNRRSEGNGGYRSNRNSDSGQGRYGRQDDRGDRAFRSGSSGQRREGQRDYGRESDRGPRQGGGRRDESRAYGDRQFNDRSQGERRSGARGRSDERRPGRPDGSDRRYSKDGPARGDRPYGGPRRDNSDGDRSYGGRTGGPRSYGGRSGGERSSGGRSQRDWRDSDDRRGGSRTYGGRDQVRRDDRRSEREDGSRRGDRTTVRPVTDVPDIPEEISIGQLDRSVRSRLRTLSKDNAEDVGRHLVMAGMLLDIDPELAYKHAQVAVSRAGRVDVVREAGAVAAYATGRYAEALREFRTVRRLNGSHEHLALMADCERGLGRPERAIALAREPEAATLPPRQRAELDIVVAGARMDMGNGDSALVGLGRIVAPDSEVQQQVDAARAAVLRSLGRDEEAAAIEATLPVPEAPEDPWADDITLYDTAELPDPDEFEEEDDADYDDDPSDGATVASAEDTTVSGEAEREDRA